VLLLFDSDEKSAGKLVNISAAAQSEDQIAVGKNGWDFHGVGIGPSSRSEVIDMKMPSLEDWTMIDRLPPYELPIEARKSAHRNSQMRGVSVGFNR
jgi:hypothetical protein